jgi:hypothetical protein
LRGGRGALLRESLVFGSKMVKIDDLRYKYPVFLQKSPKKAKNGENHEVPKRSHDQNDLK